jgi:anthranilate phosphoribosyltransferase
VEAGVKLAEQQIDSGAALAVLNAFVEESNR